MLGLILLFALGVWVLLYQRNLNETGLELPSKLASRLDRLWQVAHQSLRDKKYLRAEKALLTILRVDERNATAYNRLGILYAKQRAYGDAIECFEIAQSLDPNASSLHNVGLIYLETGQLEKAALAFEQAIEMENDVAARYIAYAKVQEKLGDAKKMVSALERAVGLDPNPQSLGILADAYDRAGEAELAAKLRKKVEAMAAPEASAKTIRQPRKVVM
ncbi:MAG: tetratricopeptide repeat protein [Candidatus Chaera renei]|uniref:Tetratricopeptide repeat protein n=1 Tax=Candidatus Chaera renei TaxID=2506947 RepID=A0A4Q0AGC6_9BACT|nr:MAG: tetratricopeptide repeat protein [Candidatus Chaera renei]